MDMQTLKERIVSLDPKVHRALRDALIARYDTDSDGGNGEFSSAPPSPIIRTLNTDVPHEFGCWVLEEWRRCSIPQWRAILREAEAQGDARREEYARWMLNVLEADDV